LCGDKVYHSESSRDALDKFQKKEISLLGAVRALNEGKNLTEPDNALIVQVDSVDRNLVQRIGRLVRVRYDNLSHKARIIILVAIDTADENWYTSAISDFDSRRIKETLVKVPDIKTET
jgi:superfamily II DNA or RNA helicase